MSGESIVNKVAQSGLYTLEVDQFLPAVDIISFDLKPYLWEGLALKERDFREALASIDWSDYAHKSVAVYCSADALIPHWAYMLVAVSLAQVTDQIHFNTPGAAHEALIDKNLLAFNWDELIDRRVVVKGCGKGNPGYSVYGKIAKHLALRAKSIMFGEPCSTVPVYKRAL